MLSLIVVVITLTYLLLKQINDLTTQLSAVRGNLPASQHKGDSIELVPVIPGYNIPFSHLPLFFVVLLLVGVIHELCLQGGMLARRLRSRLLCV